MRAGSGGGTGGSSGPGGGGLEDSLVNAAYAKLGVAVTTYFLFIDVSGSQYAHTPGTAAKMFHATAKAIKSSSNGKWGVGVGVVLRIDGTDADIGFLPGLDLSLRDTSKFATEEQIVSLFPNFIDLAVAAGDLTKTVLNPELKVLGEAAVNTGSTLEDARGAAVVPGVGDLVIRAERISGPGTLDFAYGMQYFVE